MKYKIKFINQTFDLTRNIKKFYKQKNLLNILLFPILFISFLALDIFMFPLLFLYSVSIRRKDKYDYLLEEINAKKGFV